MLHVGPADRSAAEQRLNFQQAVVFADAVGPGRRAGFDLPGVEGDGDVRDGGVLRFAAAVGRMVR